jgi:hypothetical protein
MEQSHAQQAFPLRWSSRIPSRLSVRESSVKHYRFGGSIESLEIQLAFD